MKWLRRVLGLNDPSVEEMRDAVRSNTEATIALTQALRRHNVIRKMAIVPNSKEQRAVRRE